MIVGGQTEARAQLSSTIMSRLTRALATFLLTCNYRRILRLLFHAAEKMRSGETRARNPSVFALQGVLASLVVVFRAVEL